MALAIEQFHSDTAALYNGDSVEVLAGLKDESIHYSIYSPPFASLYTYSNSERDLGNCRSYEEFFTHYKFIVDHLYRLLKPGRLCSFHCMLLPTTKEHDGYMGLRDFRGDLIRAHQAAGFNFHSEVVIWKDPLIAATRTHAHGLAHKELVKDSAVSRQGVPDYLVTMRKPGENLEPISHKPSGLKRWIGEENGKPKGEFDANPSKNKESHLIWQRYASPVWMDINPSDTLQRESAREHADERHICPLQLQVIERALELWSNPGDVVLSPFAGIGSECYVAVKMGRKAIGVELKASYYKQACGNIQAAEKEATQGSLYAHGD
jgi:DNA modification methylase